MNQTQTPEAPATPPARIVRAAAYWAYPEMDTQKGTPHWLEVTRDFYWQALEVLPPIYMPGGFFVSEADSHDERGRAVYAGFAQIGDRYFAKYATRATWAAHFRALCAALK